jgi:hypothetical protein
VLLATSSARIAGLSIFMWRSEDNLLLVVSRPLTELGALHSMVGGSEQRSKAMVFGAFFFNHSSFFHGFGFA